MKIKKIKNRKKVMSRLAKGKEVYYIELVDSPHSRRGKDYKVMELSEHSFQDVQELIQRPNAIFFKKVLEKQV